MEAKTINALQWIVDILQKNNIPYRIGGGFAAHYFGASRPINDIDISLSGQYFPILIEEVKDYISTNLKHYKNEKWDCDTLCLTYENQAIDITDIDTLKMSNRDKTVWLQTKEYFRKYPTISAFIENREVSLIDPRDLVAYKKELVDENHLYQMIDIEAVEKYIMDNNLK